MPPPIGKNLPSRRCSSSGPLACRGAFQHGYMRTGATPQRRGECLTRCLTPGLTPPFRRTAPAVEKGGSLPSFPSPLARFGSSGPGRETRTTTAETGAGWPDTPTAVFLTPLPTCASDCARPRTCPPLRPRRGPADGAPSGSWLMCRNRSSAKSSMCQRRPTSRTRSAPTRWATSTHTNGTTRRGAWGTEPRAQQTGESGSRRETGAQSWRPTIGSRVRGQLRSHLRSCPPTRPAAADAGRKLHVRRAGHDTC